MGNAKDYLDAAREVVQQELPDNIYYEGTTEQRAQQIKMLANANHLFTECINQSIRLLQQHPNEAFDDGVKITNAQKNIKTEPDANTDIVDMHDSVVEETNLRLL